MQYLAKRVSAKLEEGDYRGAVRIACSEDAIADITDETISSLREKHPGPHPESHIPSPPQPEEFVPLPAITEEEVASAILSFPRGSAGGPNGIRPQHLLNLTSASAEHGGKNLLRALTAFTNLILKGDVPQSVKPVFFGPPSSHFSLINNNYILGCIDYAEGFCTSVLFILSALSKL